MSLKEKSIEGKLQDERLRKVSKLKVFLKKMAPYICLPPKENHIFYGVKIIFMKWVMKDFFL